MDTTQKKTLADILNEFHAIEEMIIEADGCLTDEITALLDGNEAALSDKLDKYADAIAYLNGQIKYLKSQEELYKRRWATIENSIDGLRDRMTFAMQDTGNEKVKTAAHSFSIRTSESWKVRDDISLVQQSELIKAGLAEYVFKPDIKAIKDRNDKAPAYIEVLQKTSITIR